MPAGFAEKTENKKSFEEQHNLETRNFDFSKVKVDFFKVKVLPDLVGMIERHYHWRVGQS